MHRDQIQKLLRHWCQRQQQLGPESAFGFRLVIGPRKQPLFAEYADIGAPKSKTKGKGKQKEVPQLNGLLPISQTGTPTPSGSPIMSPNPMYPEIPGGRPTREVAVMEGPTQTAEQIECQLHVERGIGGHQVGSRVDELVRIDMGQMMRLKNMGHQVMGPVNGPNEGLPQYEVPRHWLQELEQITTAEAASGLSIVSPYPRPRPITKTVALLEKAPIFDPAISSATSASGQTIVRPYPRPRPITKKTALQDKEPIIDPALAINAPAPTAQTTEEQVEDVGPPDPVATIHSQSASGSGPDSNTNLEGSSVLGKRNIIVRSPPRKTQARSTQRRKVVTGDDLAYQEAQELLKGGINKRIRKKRIVGF